MFVVSLRKAFIRDGFGDRDPMVEVRPGKVSEFKNLSAVQLERHDDVEAYDTAEEAAEAHGIDAPKLEEKKASKKKTAKKKATGRKAYRDD